MTYNDIRAAINDNKQIFLEGIHFFKNFEQILSDSKSEKNTDYLDQIYEETKHEAKILLNTPINVVEFSKIKLFDTTGDRKEFERSHFERRKRLNVMAMMSLCDGDQSFIENLEDTIWAICDEYSWALEAHGFGREYASLGDENERFSLDENGQVCVKVQSKNRNIDLFAAEIGFALAECLYLLEEHLHPDVVKRAKSNIAQRLFEPYLMGGRRFEWEDAQHNWASVCAGSIGAAALYLIDDKEVLASILYKVLQSMESFLKGYGDDGACLEGASYWTYGFGYFTYFSQLLNQYTDGKINLFEGSKIDKIAQFQHRVYTSEGMFVCFSDSRPKQGFLVGLTHFHACRNDHVYVPDMAYRRGIFDDGCYRWPAFLRDYVWYSEQFGEGPPVEDLYFDEAMWLVSKIQHKDDFYCFATKAGCNDEPHNHNDVGQFILHVNGVNYLSDIGMGFYCKEYFNNQRYTILNNRSISHSVPIIDGIEQISGESFRAKDVEVTVNDGYVAMVQDISQAYPIKALKQFERKIVFHKEPTPKVVLEDRYLFDTGNHEVIHRCVTANKPTIHDGIVEIKSLNGSVTLDYDHHKYDVAIDVMPHMSRDGHEEYLYGIDFKLREKVRDGFFMVSMSFHEIAV